MIYTNWIPRPRFAVLHGLSHPTIEAARAEAIATLKDCPEVDKVELTDGYTKVFETVTR
jgi:hypothetical protein